MRIRHLVLNIGMCWITAWVVLAATQVGTVTESRLVEWYFPISVGINLLTAFVLGMLSIRSRDNI